MTKVFPLSTRESSKDFSIKQELAPVSNRVLNVLPPMKLVIVTTLSLLIYSTSVKGTTSTLQLSTHF